MDPIKIINKLNNGIYENINYEDIHNLAVETAASLSSDHLDYSVLAARLEVNHLHERLPKTFSQTIELLKIYNPSAVSNELYEIVTNNRQLIDNEINHTLDYSFDYFGLKTLIKSYLLKINDTVIETPQYLFMRVSLGIHGSDLSSAFETYHLMAQKWFIHASPTLFHAGTKRPQMSSCFLLGIGSDSIEGIYDTLKDCAVISKCAGGIGLSVHNIRAQGSTIQSTQGYSNGLVPMLRVFDATARYVDQGGGKRPGAIAIYIEPWHADIFDILDLRKNTGKEEKRARDLFYGLWISDLFMERVEKNENWSLMCPHECPGLSTCYGEEFKTLYERYESEGRFRRQIPARSLWMAILDVQIETGNPYILYKDACNYKSNQKNLGVIQCSNLCTEIIEYCDKDEIAVCNLASIILPRFVITTSDKMHSRNNTTISYFDHRQLHKIVKIITTNLNRIIDRNHYPLEAARRSNLRHRPIGIGVQGLADTFQMLGLPFESDEAKKLNKEIFETIFFAALERSCELAQIDGPYASYKGSPASQGILQHDMWNVIPTSKRWLWDQLRQNISLWGLRNSLLVAPMPTASTAQIMGNNECIEPYTRLVDDIVSYSIN
jgi:ribonucleoside-diphosphate reductase alpha subunit